jgi:CubicO group peptidase (beta-lactamase class C family)
MCVHAQPGSPGAALEAPIVAGKLGERIHELVSRVEALGFSGQVLVESNGRIVLHEAVGYAEAAERRLMTLDTGIGVASISKQFTGAAILSLEEAGRLSLDDTLAAFFGAVPSDKAGITVRQLLTHRSGVQSRTSEDFEPASQELLLTGILEMPLAFPPGRRWRYSAAGYNLLAAIIERVSGMPYADYLDVTFFEPAGMRQTFVMDGSTGPGAVRGDVSRSYLGWEDRGSPDAWPRNWRNFGAGDVVSTAADLYRWELVLRAGHIFPAEVRQRYLSPLAAVDDDVDYGYGLFFQRDDQGRLMIEHGGDAALGFNGSFYRYPDEDFLVLITCNARTPDGQWLRHTLGADIETLLRGGEPALPPDASLPTQEDVLHLPGTYVLPGEDRLQVLTDGVHLWLAPHGQGAVDLLLDLDEEGREAARHADEATLELLTGLAANDSTAYLRALRQEGAPHFADYWTEWQSLVHARGPLHAFEILGSHPGRGSVTARARLQFRTGCITMTYFWGDAGRGRLRGTFVESIPYRPVGAVALARTPEGFVAMDPFGDQMHTLHVDATGALRIDTVGDPRGVTARRQGMIGWTPPFLGRRDSR